MKKFARTRRVLSKPQPRQIHRANSVAVDEHEGLLERVSQKQWKRVQERSRLETCQMTWEKVEQGCRGAQQKLSRAVRRWHQYPVFCPNPLVSHKFLGTSNVQRNRETRGISHSLNLKFIQTLLYTGINGEPFNGKCQRRTFSTIVTGLSSLTIFRLDVRGIRSDRCLAGTREMPVPTVPGRARGYGRRDPARVGGRAAVDDLSCS